MARGIGRRFDDGSSGVKYLLSQAPDGTDTSTFIPWAADYLGRYLLPDSITSKAILALGLRGTSLTNSAALPMIRARRSSDNAERDFYAHELGAGGAITAWAGAGDAFVVTDYSVVGTNHATQSTAANQPKCVSSGVWLGGYIFSGTKLNTVSALPALGLGDFWYFSQCKNNWDATTFNLIASSDGGNNRANLQYAASSISFYLEFNNAAGTGKNTLSNITRPTGTSWINVLCSCDRNGNTSFAWKSASATASVVVSTNVETVDVNLGDGNAAPVRVTNGISGVGLASMLVGTGTLTASEIETLLNYPLPE